ncbi:MAG: hypothetical protein NTX79_07050 [Candidatus Micrarchaeota archaeon]|nr:hypothetical protein [Candidatus Micrarchaeota archaeon]
MQGAFARKKEEHKPVEVQHAPKVSPFDSSVLLSHEKKAPASPPSMSPSMSEGPMALRESQKVEKHGRDSFEYDVKKALEAMKARLAAKLAAQKKKKEKKKRRERKKKGGK